MFIDDDQKKRPQPKSGETVLHCGHLYTARSWHWFKVPELIPFKRPNGSRGQSDWIAICPPCFVLRMKAGKDTDERTLEDFEDVIRGDAIWHDGLSYKYEDPS